MKNQKGITLIALVITIIVMLILVAVSVSYGIQSGLFDKAKEGKEGWHTAQESEEDIDKNFMISTEDGSSVNLETYLSSEIN